MKTKYEYTVSGTRWIRQQFTVLIEADNKGAARRLSRLAALSDAPSVADGVLDFQIVDQLDVERVMTFSVEAHS